MALTSTSVSEPFLYLFGVKKCDFLQVFVPRVLIFKKLHLLLNSKWRYKAKSALKITNLHILNDLPNE